MSWRGYYSSTVTYNVGDIVYNNGTPWIALSSFPTGGAPVPGTDASQWTTISTNLPPADVMRTLVKVSMQPTIVNSPVGNGPLVLDFSLGNRQVILLSTSVSLLSVVNPLHGEEVSLTFKILVANLTLVYESRFQNGASVGIKAANGNATVGQYVTQRWSYDQSANLFYPTTPQLW